MNKLTDKQIDLIHEVVDSCLTFKEYDVLSMYFYNFIPQINTMCVDAKLAYLTATLPVRSQIQYREDFLNKCKELHKDVGLWENL